RPGIQYEFTIKNPNFAREVKRDHTTVTTAFTMGKQSFKEIAGILQEEGSAHALVEAIVASEPTPLLKILVGAEAEQGGERNCSGYSFRSEHSEKYSLARYDDGWRVEGPQE